MAPTANEGTARIARIVSPVDGRVYAERPLATEAEIEAALAAAARAKAGWRATPLAERAALCTRFVDAVVARKDELVPELSWQMGRPVAQAPSELRGFEDRARTMIRLAAEALADVPAGDRDGLRRFIRREPLGVVLVVAAWNYPYLISVNGVVPALMAGNTVILKHSGQTLLCAERYAEAFAEVGLPQGVFQVLHLDHAHTERVIRDERVDYVNFTGSVAGGRAVHAAAAERFITMGLELGGKDPAYVRPDAPFDHTVENLVDGAFFNSGQSCCGIERIYVHRDLYRPFVDAFVAHTERYVLGDPLDPNTNLGPMVRTSAAQHVQRQIDAAVAAGAKALVDPARFPAHDPATPYLAPQVLVEVTHEMDIMREETFGPAVGIMPVDDDEQAVALMNDSPYGLTASIWTTDEDAALRIGDRIETGTWFMNRCDVLDPELAWVGVKDSGRGCTLSRVGYEVLTRPKSFHLRRVQAP